MIYQYPYNRLKMNKMRRVTNVDYSERIEGVESIIIG
jgi:hypothetical protein